MPIIKVSVAVDNYCRVYSRSAGSFDYWAKFSGGGDGTGFSTTVEVNDKLMPTPVTLNGQVDSVTRNCLPLPTHIYCVCWSDYKTRQAIYARIDVPGSMTIQSGDPSWQVYVQGSATTNVAKPDPLTNTVKSWPDSYRALASAEIINALNAPTIGLPSVGKWMWAQSPDPYVPTIKHHYVDTSPFTPGANHGEYIVFRVILPKVLLPTMEIEIRDNFKVGLPVTGKSLLVNSLVSADTSKFDEIANEINNKGYLYAYVDTYTSIEGPGPDPSSYNKQLSKNRAMVVAAYLRSKITNPMVTMTPIWHGGAPAQDTTAYIPGLKPSDPQNRRVTVRLSHKP